MISSLLLLYIDVQLYSFSIKLLIERVHTALFPHRLEVAA